MFCWAFKFVHCFPAVRIDTGHRAPDRQRLDEHCADRKKVEQASSGPQAAGRREASIKAVGEGLEADTAREVEVFEGGLKEAEGREAGEGGAALKVERVQRGKLANRIGHRTQRRALGEVEVSERDESTKRLRQCRQGRASLKEDVA